MARYSMVVLLLIMLLSLVTAAEDSPAQEGLRKNSKVTTSSLYKESLPLFELDSVVYREDNLPDTVKQALYDTKLEHYKTQIKIIDAAVIALELERKAQESGKTRETIAGELLSIPAPDDADIEFFYETNKDRIGYPLEMVRDQIREMLMKQGMQTKQANVLAAIKRNRSFELALSMPVAPVVKIATEGFPDKGNPDAKITLVEFADYQCPHCKTAANILRQVVERYDGKVRVVFMDLPVNQSGISRTVAEGAACSDRVGKFWPYHDLAFEQQQNLDHDSGRRIAKDLGMDVSAFNECLESPFPSERVGKSESEASRLGLSSTPTLFLNGRKLHLHDIEVELPKAIEKALMETGS